MSTPKRSSWLPYDLGGVLGEGVATLLAEDRRPVVLIAQVGVARKIELRDTALTNVRAVGAGDAEHVEADVLAEIRPMVSWSSVRYREVTVDDEAAAERSRCGRQCRSRTLSCRCRCPRRRGTCRRHRRAQTSRYARIHVAELGPDLVAISAVPVDFDVIIVTVEDPAQSVVVIDCRKLPLASLQVRLRDQEPASSADWLMRLAGMILPAKAVRAVPSILPVNGSKIVGVASGC